MGRRNMKTCLASLVIGEVELNLSVVHLLTLQKSYQHSSTQCQLLVMMDMENGSATWKNSLAVSLKC